MPSSLREWRDAGDDYLDQLEQQQQQQQQQQQALLPQQQGVFDMLPVIKGVDGDDVSVSSDEQQVSESRIFLALLCSVC